jgi:hypothetical protein
MTPSTESFVALCLLELFQTLVAIGLVRELKALRESVGDKEFAVTKLREGTPAPAFTAVELRSGQQHGSELFRDRACVFLFVSPGCSFCMDIIRGLRRLPAEALARLVPVCEARDGGCKRLLKHMPTEVPLLGDPSRSIARRYGISGVPTAVLVTSLGKVHGYGHPLAIQDLRNLITDSGIASESDSRGNAGEGSLSSAALT